jgi:molybdate transport system substrate-binding protein
MRPRSFIATLLALLTAACVGTAPSPTTAPAVSPGQTTPVDATAPHIELTIFAAASLKGVLNKAKPAYEAANERVTLVISTDSSSALETKIEQGAPADVFLSADATNPQKLLDGDLVSGSLVSFAGNELTIIVPKDNPAGIRSPKDLARAGVDIIAAGGEVPITKYAKQLVDKLAALPGYPTGFASAYAANVVSKEENVGAIVGKIELGQGDAGIVYVTDAAAAHNVATVEVPPGANVPATYVGVVVAASSYPNDAQDFLAWLAGPDGQAILASFGFLAPPG